MNVENKEGSRHNDERLEQGCSKNRQSYWKMSQSDGLDEVEAAFGET
jgi:hypothetical protein